MEDNFSMDGVGVCDGSGGNASDGERWRAADEASLACPPLTSCCAAQFLTGIGTGPQPWGWGPLLYLARLSFRFVGEIKSFTDKQKIKESAPPNQLYKKC